MTSTEFKELGRGQIVVNKVDGIAYIVVSDRKWYGKEATEDEITPVQVVPFTCAGTITLDMATDYYKG